MLQLERRAAERVGEQDVVVIEDGQRDVGGVALLGVRDDVRRVRSDAGHLQDRLDRDAFPGRVELGPAGDAVDVRVDRLARQGLERSQVRVNGESTSPHTLKSQVARSVCGTEP